MRDLLSKRSEICSTIPFVDDLLSVTEREEEGGREQGHRGREGERCYVV